MLYVCKIGFGVESLKYEDDEFGGNLEKGRLGDLSVDLGYERHFKVAKRLSLYAGVQVGYINILLQPRWSIQKIWEMEAIPIRLFIRMCANI